MSSTDFARGNALLAAMAVCLLLAGCASTPKKPAQEVDNVKVIKSVRSQPAPAQAAASDSTHVTTITPTETAVQAAAQQALGDYFAGVQMMKAGKLDDALVVFQQISAEHPTLSGPLVNQALILYRQERSDEAMDIIGQALKINDRNPFAWNLKGMILRENGKFADAKTAYERALAIDTNYAKAHFNLGILSDLYLQDLRTALAHYEQYQSLQRKPDQAVGNWINDLRNRLGIVAPAAAPAPAPAPVEAAPTEQQPAAEGAPAPADAPAAATTAG